MKSIARAAVVLLFTPSAYATNLPAEVDWVFGDKYIADNCGLFNPTQTNPPLVFVTEGDVDEGLVFSGTNEAGHKIWTRRDPTISTVNPWYHRLEFVDYRPIFDERAGAEDGVWGFQVIVNHVTESPSGLYVDGWLILDLQKLAEIIEHDAASEYPPD